MVVVDHLGPLLELWRESCDVLAELGVTVMSEEEGSQQVRVVMVWQGFEGQLL